jgi:phosphoribosyl 1,2-cyclic phosphodiesterase
MVSTGQEGTRRSLLLLLSHVHWDHIQGFPFFAPANSDMFEIDVCGGPPNGGTWREALYGQMQPPYCPIPLSELRATVRFSEWPPHDPAHLHSFRVSRAPTNHPGGGFAYRIECDGQSIVYATDTEHPQSGVDENLLSLCSHADVLLYDATFFPEEHRERLGWGHSTWTHGVQLATAASVRRLVLFHHDPSRDDASLRRMEEMAQAGFNDVEVAREGPLQLD